jgi:Ca2+-binding EF-hand superfamily protein
MEYPIMKRSTTRILTATAIAGIGLVGLAAVSLADDDSRPRWRMQDGEDCRGLGGPGMGGHGMGGFGMGGFGFSGHGGGRGGMHGMLLGFDANDDGKLSQEEIDQGRANQLKKFDKDGDGTLNLAEYEALWLDAKRERMVDRFQGHDADGDGKVTAEEFGERFADMVKFMDSNDDGVLDESDMRRRYGGEGRRKNDD